MPKRRRPKKVDNDAYDVGYGKPPAHSRFRPGQSGNPAGRKKGVRNLKTDVMRVLTAPVKVKQEGKTRTGSTQEAALMVLREKALRGDARALDRICELAFRFNNDSLEGDVAQPLVADDRAILANYVTKVTTSSVSDVAQNLPDDLPAQRRVKPKK